MNADHKLAIARTFRKIFIRIDNANLRILKLIPVRIKRKAYRSCFRQLAYFSKHTPLEVEGFRMSVPANALQIFAVDTVEPEVRNSIRTFLAPGDVAIDVGAYIGFHTMLMASIVGQKGTVYAFEPAVDSREYLIKNCRDNELYNVIIHPFAAGDNNREVEFYFGETSTLNSRRFREDARVTRVTERRLDDVICGKVNFVKIDVEGHELNVLNGMRRIISENPFLRIVVEWDSSFQAASGFDETDLPQALFDAGFCIAPAINPKQLCRTIDELYLATDMQKNRYHRVNLLAVRSP